MSLPGMEEGREAAVGAEGLPPPRTGARVLIVDDDERNAFAACQILEDLGHSLVVARSGAEALRLLLEGDFAVILLDLHMPDMDGYETARFIRSHPRTRQIPIVFVTAVFRDEAHLFQAYSAGAVDVVFKPVDPFILRSKVSVLADLKLRTSELTHQTRQLRALLEENGRIHAEKLSAERALRRSQERQESILGVLPIVFHSRRAKPPFAPLFVSDQCQAVFGFAPAAFTDEPAFGFDRIHPDDAPSVEAALRSALEKGAYSCEFRWRCADGAYRHFLDQGALAPAEEDGEPILFGSLQDVTERKGLEEQLTQARKMEAVGQLTGGVAHDFNNLLTVVLGNADILLRKLGTDDARLGRHLGAIRQAAEKGQALTRQLLTFSRRERLRPVVVEVNALAREFLPLLAQAVGESISIRTHLTEELLRVDVDPNHLESALLNLAVNARDAMPGGGELHLTTRLAPGGLVAISVRDHGAGMSPAVRARVFEPFFTTKDVGKGSGLGLSQVYGFVQQSGGRVEIESTEGKGCEITLLLPITEKSPPAPKLQGAGLAPARGQEKLLVVEDDKAVLALTVEMLKGLGYGVRTASNAKMALGVLKGPHKIDALLSDVVMPGGVSGLQLAKTARQVRPDLPILLTSGYMGSAVPPKTDFPLLDKPYELATLASRLRDVLDGRSAASGE